MLNKKYFPNDDIVSLENYSQEIKDILSEMDADDIFNFLIATNDNGEVASKAKKLHDNITKHGKNVINAVKVFRKELDNLAKFVDDHSNDLESVADEGNKKMGKMLIAVNDIDKACQQILKSSGFETDYGKLKNYKSKNGLSSDEMDVFSLPYELRGKVGFTDEIVDDLYLASTMHENIDYPMRAIHYKLSNADSYLKNVNENSGLMPSLYFMQSKVFD